MTKFGILLKYSCACKVVTCLFHWGFVNTMQVYSYRLYYYFAYQRPQRNIKGLRIWHCMLYETAFVSQVTWTWSVKHLWSVFLINLLRHDDKASMFTVTDKNARKIQINKSRICQPQRAKKGNVSAFSFKPVIYANISMRVISMWLMKCLCALSHGSTFSRVTEWVRDTACRKAKADINNLR